MLGRYSWAVMDLWHPHTAHFIRRPGKKILLLKHGNEEWWILMGIKKTVFAIFSKDAWKYLERNEGKGDSEQSLVQGLE